MRWWRVELFLLALLVDSAALLAAGLMDYRRLEVPDGMYYPLLATPFAAYLLAPGLLRAALLGLAGLLLLVFLLAHRARNVAEGDLLVFIRIPAVVFVAVASAAGPLVVAAFVGGLAAAVAIFAARLGRALCQASLRGIAYVRRERYMDLYVFPPGVDFEDDWEAIRARKMALLEASQGECLEARLGLPLVFIFSLGYLAAVAAAALAA